MRGIPRDQSHPWDSLLMHHLMNCFWLMIWRKWLNSFIRSDFGLRIQSQFFFYQHLLDLTFIFRVIDLTPKVLSTKLAVKLGKVQRMTASLHVQLVLFLWRKILMNHYYIWSVWKSFTAVTWTYTLLSHKLCTLCNLMNKLESTDSDLCLQGEGRF